MDKKDLLLWLYEQKDEIDKKLYGVGGYDRAEGNYRDKLFAELNTYDKVVAKIKKESKLCV